MISALQHIDPKVSEIKFAKELEQFNKNRGIQRKRGIILLDAKFPNIFIAFSAIKLNPPPIVFAVKINFNNYDLEPPSVVFIDPFTFESITQLNQISIHFLRKIPNSKKLQPLLQQDNGNLPFICFPGIREYHNHPAHTGDSWLLHRNIGGEGSLGFIVDKLYDYGITPLITYQVPALNIPIIKVALDPNIVSE